MIPTATMNLETVGDLDLFDIYASSAFMPLYRQAILFRAAPLLLCIISQTVVQVIDGGQVPTIDRQVPGIDRHLESDSQFQLAT
jgi:hypothetical protein